MDQARLGQVVAISDVGGGVYNPKGLDFAQFTKYKLAGLGPSVFPEGESITNAELLELDCDVLIPAAIDNVITRENATKVKASLILEAANHPGDADRGTRMVPYAREL